VQPLLVFADDGRSMGLVVDEIVDIVEDRLRSKWRATCRACSGSAVIKGRRPRSSMSALPAAGFRRLVQAQGMRVIGALKKQAAFVDDSAFFRNMLAPVLQAAGYDVTELSSGGSAGDYRAGARFDLRRHRYRNARDGRLRALPKRCARMRARRICRSSHFRLRS
jgi:two-component system chemotaxis sensor kinase CheA